MQHLAEKVCEVIKGLHFEGTQLVYGLARQVFKGEEIQMELMDRNGPSGMAFNLHNTDVDTFLYHRLLSETFEEQSSFGSRRTYRHDNLIRLVCSSKHLVSPEYIEAYLSQNKDVILRRKSYDVRRIMEEETGRRHFLLQDRVIFTLDYSLFTYTQHCLTC